MATLGNLADCICDALKADRGSAALNWDGVCCIQPGSQVAFDHCCEGEGGQAWVMASGGYLTNSFPTPAQATDPRCNNGYSQAVRIEVGAIRCVCYDGCSCEAKEQNAEMVLGDLRALIQGISCCFTNDDGDGDTGWWIERWELIGPDGGCGGAKISLLVEQPLPCCPSGG